MRALLVLAATISVGCFIACSDDSEQPTGGTSASGGGGEGASGASDIGGSGGTPATTGGFGGGGGPDIGDPSDVYPAPHPDPPIVVNLGGRVLENAQFYNVYFTGDDTELLDQMTAFSDQVGASEYWGAATSEYGVGPATSGPPITVDETVAGSIDDSEIAEWLAAKINSNDPAFPVPDENTLIALFYPVGVDVTLSDGQGLSHSCFDFGAYHSSVVLDAAHGNLDLPYAVMPRCGQFGPLSGLDALTGPTSHEFVEAATDPNPQHTPAYGQTDNNHIYYLFALGGETGDLCAQNDGVFVDYPDFQFVAQRSYSNASALAGHDPCVPLLADTVYFNAVPVMKDTLDFGGGLTFKGVQIPVGESKTIDVALFSDGPTGGPFTVDAFDQSDIFGGPKTLDFSFDAYEGQNGQTLHLTITSLTAGQFGASLFFLVAELGGQRNTWIGIVGE